MSESTLGDRSPHSVAIDTLAGAANQLTTSMAIRDNRSSVAAAKILAAGLC
jgi:hypothetical protein